MIVNRRKLGRAERPTQIRTTRSASKDNKQQNTPTNLVLAQRKAKYTCKMCTVNLTACTFFPDLSLDTRENLSEPQKCLKRWSTMKCGLHRPPLCWARRREQQKCVRPQSPLWGGGQSDQHEELQCAVRLLYTLTTRTTANLVTYCSSTTTRRGGDCESSTQTVAYRRV